MTKRAGNPALLRWHFLLPVGLADFMTQTLRFFHMAVNWDSRERCVTKF